MLTLEQLLDKKLVIYRLAEEWGFVVDIAKNDVPYIFVDPLCPEDQAKVCLLVKPDLRVGNTGGYVSTRIGFLEQELSLLLNVNISVDTEYSLNDHIKSLVLKEAISLSENHQTIIHYFAGNKIFKDYNPELSDHISIFEDDTLKNIEEIKRQIASKKPSYRGTAMWAGFYAPINSLPQNDQINSLITLLKMTIQNIQSSEQKKECKQ